MAINILSESKHKSLSLKSIRVPFEIHIYKRVVAVDIKHSSNLVVWGMMLVDDMAGWRRWVSLMHKTMTRLI